MAHDTQAIPVTSATVAVQKFDGTDERQEVTEVIPEGGTALAFSVTTSSQVLLSANGTRVEAFLQNQSPTATVWINFGAAAALNSGISIPPGQSITVRDQREIRVIGSAACTLTGYEFTTT